jgi:hypothetical protein
MDNCNCNQGRLDCTCDKRGTVERNPVAHIVVVVAAIVLAGLYLITHWMIGQ